MTPAYSQTQWSWDRIDQLGGLNPEDPRQTLGQGDACETPYSAGFCQQQREQRLTALDLAAVEDDFGQCEPNTPLRLVDGGELDAYYTDLIGTGALRGAPAVILPDPLGDARYHAYQHSFTAQKIIKFYKSTSVFFCRDAVSTVRVHLTVWLGMIETVLLPKEERANKAAIEIPNTHLGAENFQ